MTAPLSGDARPPSEKTVGPPPETGFLTFQEAYCRAQGCAAEQFTPRVLRAALYPAGRLLWALGFSRRACFDADRELVSQCGRLRGVREIKQEVRQYSEDPKNRGLWRGFVRVRVSGRRVLRLAEAVLATAKSGGRD